MNFRDKKEKDAFFTHLSSNKYCHCKPLDTKCLICQHLEKGEDYTQPNKYAVDKYRVSVTGTNGKTTVTTIIGQVLTKFYHDKVGYATSAGIVEGGKRTVTLEHRASEFYTYLLNNPKYDFVVSEQPIAGLFKFGLPIDHHFGIITNITEDHLEKYYIKNKISNLYQYKSLVAKSSIEGVITSVDYKWTREVIDNFDRGQFFLFGLEHKNVASYVKKGYQVTTVEDGRVVIKDKSGDLEVGKVSDFDMTVGGALSYNVENLLPIISLFYNSKKFKSNFINLIEILKTTSLSFEINPCRFNIFQYKKSLVIFDYAHNISGYQKSVESLEFIKKNTAYKKAIGLVSVAADRSEKAISNIASIVDSCFDLISVRIAKENHASEKLFTEIKKTKTNSSRWTDDFSKFIEEKYSENSILYITIAGHAHIAEIEKTIKDLSLKEIAISKIFT